MRCHLLVAETGSFNDNQKDAFYALADFLPSSDQNLTTNYRLRWAVTIGRATSALYVQTATE